MVEGNDPYVILGVPRSAELRDIHKAWRRLARIHHPDRYPPEKRYYQTAVSQRINQAWETIQRENTGRGTVSTEEYVPPPNSIAEILRLLENRIIEQVNLAEQNVVTESLPDGLLDSPAARGLPRQLYRHQGMALAALLRSENTVISTGTASGKSLIFQTFTMHRMIQDPEATAIIWYPLKALASDQERSWRERAEKTGFPAEWISRIDGDVPVTERGRILRNTRIAVMTPDIAHAWLLRHRNNPDIRDFLRKLQLLILDEAHVYETVFGSHTALLLRRLEAARREESASGRKLQYIAATATILEPAQHLEKLTGAPFTSITEADDGAPRQKRTLAHVATASDAGEARERSLSNVILEILQLPNPPKFIAFIDSRQGSERVVRLLREKAGALVDPEERERVAERVNRVQPYRSGYDSYARQSIERALRDGSLPGIITTSAMELGIDFPDLDLGINAGMPSTRKSFRQRAGRIGRRRPGAFLILAPSDSFSRYGDSLKDYWEKSVESSHLYLDNEVFHFVHSHCLARESRSPQSFTNSLNGIPWPDGFSDVAWKVWNGQPFPRFDPIAFPVTQDRKAPHIAWGIRDLRLPEHEIVEELNQSRVGKIGAEQAIRETYPGACYLHLQQGWRITGWRDQFAGPAIINARRLRGDATNWDPRALTEANHKPALPEPGSSGNDSRDNYRRTDPIIDASATVRLNKGGVIEGRLTNFNAGTLAEAWADLNQTVIGWDEGNRTYLYEDYIARRPGLKAQSIEIPTTGVLLQINLPWFNSLHARRRIASELINFLCHDQSIQRKDVAWTDDRIFSLNDVGGREPLDNAILIYDTVYGGMQLTAALYDNLPEYARRMNRAGSPGLLVAHSGGSGSGDIFQLFAEFAESLSAVG